MYRLQAEEAAANQAKLAQKTAPAKPSAASLEAKARREGKRTLLEIKSIIHYSNYWLLQSLFSYEPESQLRQRKELKLKPSFEPKVSLTKCIPFISDDRHH